MTPSELQAELRETRRLLRESEADRRILATKLQDAQPQQPDELYRMVKEIHNHLFKGEPNGSV